MLCSGSLWETLSFSGKLEGCFGSLATRKMKLATRGSREGDPRLTNVWSGFDPLAKHD